MKTPVPAELDRKLLRRLTVSICGRVYEIQITAKLVPAPQDLSTLPTPDHLM